MSTITLSVNCDFDGGCVEGGPSYTRKVVSVLDTSTIAELIIQLGGCIDDNYIVKRGVSGALPKEKTLQDLNITADATLILGSVLE